MGNNLTIKGVSDEVLECQKCGKVELKRTIVLTDGESEMYYGSQCAARALGMRRKSAVDRIADAKSQGKYRKPKTPMFRDGRLCVI